MFGTRKIKQKIKSFAENAEGFKINNPYLKSLRIKKT